LSHPDASVRTLAAERLGESREMDLLLPLAARLLEPRADARAAAMEALMRRGELTLIPGALAVIFGRPRASLFEGDDSFVQNLAAAVRRFSTSLTHTAQETRAAFSRLLVESGIAALASGLLSDRSSH
jgi:HEAT repeat protein